MTITPERLLLNLAANPHPKQTLLEMAGGFAYITIDTHKIAYDGERWFVCGQQITPQFPMNNLHQEIDRVFVLARKIKDHVLNKTTTPTWEQIKADCVGPDLPTEQTFVSIDRYRELEAELKTITEERDKYKASYDYAQSGLHEVWDATGWLEKADNEPCGIEYLKRLKSKADRAGLLSVVCRRLCGDENATSEIVHKALDLFDDQRNALDYITQKIQCGSDPTSPHGLQAIGHTVAQTVKSLSEKTVEVAKLQEGLTNYKAHVEGLTKRVEQLAFERDTERVSNKWKAETIEDLKRTTVKLPNEHTLRRLFNRHNTPEKYRDGTAIPTMERLLMLIESLESQVSVQIRRAEHMALVNCNHEAMISDTHTILDEHGVQSYAGDTYLGIPARLRQLFATHTKV